MKLLFKLLQFFAPSKLPITEAPTIETCTPGTHEFIYTQYEATERTYYRGCKNCPYTEFKHSETDTWKPANLVYIGTNTHGKAIFNVTNK